MTSRCFGSRLVGALLLVLAPGLSVAADLQVLTAGAYRAVLVDLSPLIERQTGDHLIIRNATAGGVADAVRDGEPVDLIVLPPANGQALGALLGPLRPLARVGIGVAVKAGAVRPDIATPEAVRAAVLGARAPAWIDPAAGASSGIYLTKLWAQWGIAGQLAPKAVLVQGGLVSDALSSGAADLAFQQVSELMRPGIDVVGPLPPAIQNWTIYAGAVPGRSAQAAAAARVLNVLAGPEAAPVLQAHGMEPP